MELKESDIKVGTPIEAIWDNVKKQCETQLLQMKVEKQILEQNLELAEKKIKQEQDAL